MMVFMLDAVISPIKEQYKCMLAFIQHYGVRAFILAILRGNL